MEKDCSNCIFKPLNMETIGAFCKQGHLSDYLNESIKDCHGWKWDEEEGFDNKFDEWNW